MNLMFSTVFPAYHPRRGEPTEFVEKILGGRKVHTVHENLAYWKLHDGKRVNLCVWSGKPYGNGSSPRVFASAKIRVNEIGFYRKIREPQDFGICFFDCGANPAQIPFAEFAQGDGLTEEDFNNWFPVCNSLAGSACIWLDDVRAVDEEGGGK